MRYYADHKDMQSEPTDDLGWGKVPGSDEPKALLDYTATWRENSDQTATIEILCNLEAALRVAIGYPEAAPRREGSEMDNTPTLIDRAKVLEAIAHIEATPIRRENIALSIRDRIDALRAATAPDEGYAVSREAVMVKPICNCLLFEEGECEVHTRVSDLVTRGAVFAEMYDLLKPLERPEWYERLSRCIAALPGVFPTEVQAAVLGMPEARQKALQNFARALAAAQVDTPPEVKRLIDERFWDLVGEPGRTVVIPPQPAPDIAALVAEADRKVTTGDAIEYRFVRELAAALTTLSAQLQQERERAGESGRHVTCVYCGHQYEDGTPESQDARLTAHIKECEKHPMRELEAELLLLRACTSPKCVDAWPPWHYYKAKPEVERERDEALKQVKLACDTSAESVNAVAKQRDAALTRAEQAEAALAEAQRMLDEAGFKICPQCGEWADDFCSNEDDAEAFCMDCHAKAPFECNQCSFRVFSPEEFEGKCGSSGCDGDLIRRVLGEMEE